MEDPHPPSAQPKKKLLFKRTIPRKSAETHKEDDDGLSLFSRSNEFFPTVLKDREREAAEKAAKAAKAEKERKEKLERAQREKEETEKLYRRKKRGEDEEESPSAKKRRHVSLSDNDSDDAFTTKPHKTRKSSTLTPISPDSKRGASRRDSIAKTPRSTRSSRASQRQNVSSSAAITLDSSDEDETKHSLSVSRHKRSPVKRRDSLEESDLDFDIGGSPLGGGTDGADASFNIYVQGALERAEKRKRERLEREAAARLGASSSSSNNNTTTGAATTSTKNGTVGTPSSKSATTDEPVVSILISCSIDGIRPIVFRRKLHQPLEVVHRTWVEQQVAKHAPLTRAALQGMFFTWRGDKVYQTTTLETLGIRPDASDGGALWQRKKKSWRDGTDDDDDVPNGYHGRDKVHFEAWTPELYEDYLRCRERERRRARGELVSDDEEEGGEGGGEGGSGGQRDGSRAKSGDPEQQEEQKNVKIILKARGMDPEHIKVRPSTSIAMLVVVFKRLKKLPPEKSVELHWDGEVLDPDSTIEDAEIEDMDSIEVHIK